VLCQTLGGRPGQNLRPDDRQDRDVGHVRDGGVAIAEQSDRRRAESSGIGQAADHIRRTAADRVPTTTSLRLRPTSFSAAAPALCIVLGALGCFRESVRAASINPSTMSAGTLNVAGHSAASRTPNRPLVPAPK
jgi:hypothetical protein